MKLLSFYLFVLLTIIIISCKEKIIEEKLYILEGTVINKSTGLPIEGVMIAIKNHSLPDSAIFLNDSIILGYPHGYSGRSLTKDNGSYYLDWEGSRQEWILKDLFAFKTGYKIWRFQENKDTLKRINEGKDVLNIKLELK
jgi:hypothetical protein